MCLLDGAEKVYLLNRTVEKAQAIAVQMNGLGKDTMVIPKAMKDYATISEENLIVFQATSIGLSPNVDQVVLDDPAFYKKVRIGVDLIYNPATTKFMQLVMEQGGKAYNALKMLLYQGVIAYELWHDILVPQDIIDDIYVDLKRKVYPKDNYVLIGFMGSGKSTIAAELSRMLHRPVLEMDEEIEKREGMSIPAIFSEHGEAYFRQLETDLLKETSALGGFLVSCGGGAAMREENVREMKKSGIIVLLTALPETILERVADDENRPLLKGRKNTADIEALIEKRRPAYEAAANYQVATDQKTSAEIAGEILGILEKEGMIS